MKINIPDEAVEAAAREQASRDNVAWETLNDIARLLRLDDARASLAAALAAWPNKTHHEWDGQLIVQIKMPLTKEPRT